MRLLSNVNLGRSTLALIVAAALANSAGTAFGLEPDPLKGPAVKDHGAPGDHRKLAEGNDPGQRERPYPHMAFMHAVEQLRGEGSPEGLRLTDAQRTEIDKALSEFRTAMGAYRKEHQEEVRSAMKDLSPEDRRAAMRRMATVMGRPEGEPGQAKHEGRGEGRPGGERKGRRGEPRPADADAMKSDDAKPSGDSEAAKARLKALAQGAPKPDGMRAQVFGVLSAEQRAFVEKEVESVQKRGDEMIGKKRAEHDKKRLDEAGQKKSELREKLKDMSPEERRKAIEELREKRKAKNGG